jgi:hypothetical protein
MLEVNTKTAQKIQQNFFSTLHPFMYYLEVAEISPQELALLTAEQISELSQIVLEHIKEDEVFKQYGLEPKRSIVMRGVSNNGQSTVANYLSKELNLPIIEFHYNLLTYLIEREEYYTTIEYLCEGIDGLKGVYYFPSIYKFIFSNQRRNQKEIDDLINYLVFSILECNTNSLIVMDMSYPPATLKWKPNYIILEEFDHNLFFYSLEEEIVRTKVQDEFNQFDIEWEEEGNKIIRELLGCSLRKINKVLNEVKRKAILSSNEKRLSKVKITTQNVKEVINIMDK